jgi:hypothetical protein
MSQKDLDFGSAAVLAYNQMSESLMNNFNFSFWQWLEIYKKAEPNSNLKKFATKRIDTGLMTIIQFLFEIYKKAEPNSNLKKQAFEDIKTFETFRQSLYYNETIETIHKRTKKCKIIN